MTRLGVNILHGGHQWALKYIATTGKDSSTEVSTEEFPLLLKSFGPKNSNPINNYIIVDSLKMMLFIGLNPG